MNGSKKVKPNIINHICFIFMKHHTRRIGSDKKVDPKYTTYEYQYWINKGWFNLSYKKAFYMMRDIIVPIGCNQQNKLVDSINIKDDEPMNRLMAFNNMMDIKGAAQFNKRLYVKKQIIFAILK